MLYFKQLIITVLVINLTLGMPRSKCEDDCVNPSPFLDIPNLGKIQGCQGTTSWTEKNFTDFRGIPYAKPPIGRLRLKPPVKYSGWNGTLDATKYAQSCPILDAILKLSPKDQNNPNLEDCLTLNVFTKDIRAKRPVMVYIHGGALVHGTASDNRPDFLLEKDIVLVTLQYRLGALGFLATKTSEIPGNMGVMDVMLALEWVQKNIQYFGGDNTKVTIFGESAGACLVALLIISPRVRKDLFQQAIMQSGNSLLDVINTIEPIDRARKTCNLLNCTKCDEISNIELCLINAPLKNLLEASKMFGLVPFGFVHDDYYNIYPKSPKQAVADGQNCYPFMIGITKHEGGFLTAIAESKFSKPRDYHNYLLSDVIEPDHFGTLSVASEDLYFSNNDINNQTMESMRAELVDISGDFVFKFSLIKWLDLHLLKCLKNKNYLYAFDYYGKYYWKPFLDQFLPVIEGKLENTKCLVHHASDLVYLFPTEILNVNDTKMAQKMVELWTTFAINGTPESGSVKIPHLTSSRGPYFHINEKITIGNNIMSELKIATKEKRKCASKDPGLCCVSK